ncbi:hypothetical protein DKE52_021070 (plasmid) [Acinetobacter pittii]|uniref:Uncharacterized protein n=1 Tax=Acinetobacter pittii TaxID=48296 RepID=A0A3G6YNY9_ACIPI|nr:hypothetical protein DKE52_021070 [Acinetobacter pittii]
MVMNNIEYDTVVESAKIKAKSDITVAVLNNAASTGLVAINDASKEKAYRVYQKLHDQIDE